MRNVTLPLLYLGLAACGPQAVLNLPADSGVPPDTGVEPDAGAPVDAGEPVDAGMPEPDESFDITLFIASDSLPLPVGVLDDLAWVKARWESVITDDLPDVLVADVDCVVTGNIDDLAVYVSFVAGAPGGDIAEAKPVCLRNQTQLPATGTVKFELADYDPQTFRQVALHNFGHVLGFGSLWALYPDEFLQDPTCEPVPCTLRDTRYIGGMNANREWYTLTGTTAEFVPVENAFGVGVSDQNWRENSPLRNELMSTTLSSIVAPLSRVTIGALEDLGYEVNYDAADAFVLAAP